ncbi:MAG: hypothetical protein K0R89_980 [Ramlibacter sp.]|jgi:hypothetical protein|nr:hypothetical protein [Ramlibacter sp.]
MDVTDAQIRHAIELLLGNRKPPATICPSEAARALTPDDWRVLMARVRAVAISMAREGQIEIRQGGRRVQPAGSLRGPIRLGHSPSVAPTYPTTPDGRYFVVRGRLWRKTNPHLPDDVREALIKQLMDARRALRRPLCDAERGAAREQVDQAKRALGERGPVWWTDGAPDYNRKLARNTPYRDWFIGLFS